MKILFGYVPEAVRPESMACIQGVQAAGHDVRMVELHGPYAYWDAFRAMFAEGEAFLNLEHDIVITLDQISAIEACNLPICAYGYGMVHEGDILPAIHEWVTASARGDHEAAAFALVGQITGRGRYCLGLGATKFSAALVERAGPGILAADRVSWKWLEFGLQAHFPELVGKYHHHEPPVVHF